MLIPVNFDQSSGWTVDENKAVQIPEFKALLSERDGTRALAFVALACDPAGFLYELYEDETDRMTEAAKSVFGKQEKSLKNKKVTDAIAKYKKLSMTKMVKIRQQIQKGLAQVGDYVEKTGGSLDEDNVDAFMKTLKEMPKLLNEMEEVTGEKEKTGKTLRGKRVPTYREQKLMGSGK